MSGIYVQCMEMPKDGFITITVTFDGRVVGNSKKESGKFEYLDNEDIASAIPVPDHGKLIDADALMLRVDLHGTNKFGMLDDDIREFVNSAPTIIPASKEGEDNT